MSLLDANLQNQIHKLKQDLVQMNTAQYYSPAQNPVYQTNTLRIYSRLVHGYDEFGDYWMDSIRGIVQFESESTDKTSIPIFYTTAVDVITSSNSSWGQIPYLYGEGNKTNAFLDIYFSGGTTVSGSYCDIYAISNSPGKISYLKDVDR